MGHLSSPPAAAITFFEVLAMRSKLAVRLKLAIRIQVAMRRQAALIDLSTRYRVPFSVCPLLISSITFLL